MEAHVSPETRLLRLKAPGQRIAEALPVASNLLWRARTGASPSTRDSMVLRRMAAIEGAHAAAEELPAALKKVFDIRQEREQLTPEVPDSERQRLQQAEADAEQRLYVLCTTIAAWVCTLPGGNSCATLEPLCVVGRQERGSLGGPGLQHCTCILAFRLRHIAGQPAPIPVRQG